MGSLNGNGPEKQAQASSKIQILSLSRQHLTIQPRHWGALETCLSHIAQNTLVTANQYSPSHQQQGSTSLMPTEWSKCGLAVANHPSSCQKPVYFGFSDWTAAPPKKPLKHRRLTWMVMLCDLHLPSIKWLWNERDQFCGLYFGQLWMRNVRI